MVAREKTLDIDTILVKDDIGVAIAERYQDWETRRQNQLQIWKEILQYVFATDTTQTTNSKLPWSNKTTIPKLCQIRENLFANYMAALFPKRKWWIWEGASTLDEMPDKKEAIEAFIGHVVTRNEFYDTMSRLVYDFIDHGNSFIMVEWQDKTVLTDTKEQVGYVGPIVRRISPLDLVMDPTASDFLSTPKILRSYVSLGALKDIMLKNSVDEDEKLKAEELFKYLKETREAFRGLTSGSLQVKDTIFQIAGFTSFQDYMTSGTAEVLTFYGDFYDSRNDKLYKNHVIMIVDRHKIVYMKPNTSSFGHPPIYHCGWRLRPDNLWAASPLENLVGMQYRIDHLENMKADCFDLIAYPPLLVRGYVEDFEWKPMERIIVGEGASVDMLAPDVQALQADNQIAILEAKMEEMSGSPREAMGFRTPGEKTKYEVQSLENAASRIFQSKIAYFERQIIDNTINALLEMGRRNLQSTTIRFFDDELKIALFKELTLKDITGNGRLRPIAARHFAEQANMVQNLTAFKNSAAGQDPSVRQHFSSIKEAKLWERLLELEDFKLVEPFIQISEQADQQMLANRAQEQVAIKTNTPTGYLPGDYDNETELPPDQGAGIIPGVVPGA